VNAFIDAHRARLGVEPICNALQVAPSAYWRHAARQRNPALLPARTRRDAQLLPQVRRLGISNNAGIFQYSLFDACSRSECRVEQG